MPKNNEPMIKGKFKTLDDIKTTLGISDNDRIDSEYLSILQKLAEKNILLGNFNPVDKTFFPIFIEPNPKYLDDSDKYITVTPTARDMRHMRHLPLSLLETVECINCDELIYCTGCGSTFEKNYKYPIEPHFTYGNLWDGECTIETTDDNNISGTTVVIKICGENEHEIFCSTCREMHLFKQLEDALS